jgi:adenylosuccinate synthase
MKQMILLSGPIASGKSSLAKHISVQLGLGNFSTSSAIKKLLGEGSREELQGRGQALDADRPEWLWEEIRSWMNSVVVDSVRAVYQIDMLRKKALEQRVQVVHIHLTASDESLRERFEARNELSKYAKVKFDILESSVHGLASIADLVINTSKCTKEDTKTLAMAAITSICGSRFTKPNVDVLVGGQYGSEGKGHVVAHIAPEYAALMRVGGPNAGHSVLFNGNHVSFYHLPSGVLHSPRAEIILGAGININVDVLEKEIALAESLGVKVRHRLHIDKNVNIIRPGDIAAEKSLVNAIGSTGQGVGVATAARIIERAYRDTLPVTSLPENLYSRVCDVQDILGRMYQSNERVLLEGTQGTGLSLFHGPYPYVTSRDTTASGTMAESGIAPGRIRKVIMVVRSNPIRVQSPNQGSSGPMSKEISWEDVSAKASVDAQVLRERERTTTTKRQRRVSEFDWALLQRSAQLNMPTDIALTFADYISPENTKARRFEQLTVETQKFINDVEMVTQAPVSMITTRLHERSIIDRRQW